MNREFRVPIAKPKALGPEVNPWFWNPNRYGVKYASDDVMTKLRQIGDDLSITWNPINERWQVFCSDQRIQHSICHGWRLLFIHNGPDGEYSPPDERLLARVFSISARHQNVNGKQYFDRIVSEMARDKAKRDEQNRLDTIDAAMPSFEYSQIKNIGKGNKFATYFS